MSHARARSIWARQLAQHLVRVGVLPQVVDVRGKPPSPDCSDGAWVIGPQR